MSDTELASPEEFAAEGLARLWAVLQSYPEEGWDYHVTLFRQFISISFESSAKGKRDDNLEGVHRIVKALDDRHPRIVIIHAHHGGGGLCDSNRQWIHMQGFLHA